MRSRRSGADSIQFNIGSGTPTIIVTSALPSILEAVTIDGNTGSATRVELNGNGVSANGLFLDGHGNTIRGLVINRFNGSGIWLNSSNNNTIEGNYIGTSADGTTTAGFGNSSQGISIADIAEQRDRRHGGHHAGRGMHRGVQSHFRQYPLRH